jgi:pyruvate dehydrogenase E2 component (dihydrolipoamide acetyltransferase)
VSTIKQVVVPDIGDTNPVEVIEVLVKAGDSIEKEDSLITLESEKASMDIPAPFAGKVKNIEVKVGDKISQGDLILSVEYANGHDESKDAITTVSKAQDEKQPEPVEIKHAQDAVETEEEITLTIPDLGTDDSVSVIEVSAKVGDKIEKEDTIVTLESEKASMDVPSTHSGTLLEIFVKEGGSVKTGDKFAKIKAISSVSAPKVSSTKPESKTPESPAIKPAEQVVESQPVSVNNGEAHAGPATRKLANELGVILEKISGSGRKGRIISVDVKAYVKKSMQQGASQAQGGGLNIEPMPEIDFSQFGTIETTKLSRIKKLTAKNMARNWVSIPHVTQFDEADVTELESFRNQNKQAAMDNGIRLTPLAFILKGVAGALQSYPQFNSSISNDGQNLILKKYFNIGVAVNTPSGLVVPVVTDVDKKGIFEIARELSDLSKKAREGKLTKKQMQGQSFTISSLGNLGGTAFTPIINAPDVAILGLAKMQTKPVYINKQFEARKMLPLCLSYDHRVIDGAEAAIFTSKIADMLQDIRNMLL